MTVLVWLAGSLMWTIGTRMVAVRVRETIGGKT